VIRQEPRRDPEQGGVLTVTGLVPTPVSTPDAWGVSGFQSSILSAPVPQADDMVTQLFRHTRSLLTLKGRPPFRLAGMDTYERLDNVARFSLDLLAKRSDQRLAHRSHGLQSALSPFAQTYQDLQQGAAWLRDIASILAPVSSQALTGQQVAEQLRAYLDVIRRQNDVSPTIHNFGQHLDKVSRRYWPGLFHCYEVPGLLLNHLWETRLAPQGRPYTLTEVSKATGMSVPYLSSLRKGTIGAVPFHRVDALARFFHVPLEYFRQEGPPTDTMDDLVREALAPPLVRELTLRAGKIGLAQRALVLQMLEHADQVLHEFAPPAAAPSGEEQAPPRAEETRPQE
jgi:transcriptional regulator with XRE-family HTH domain